MHTPVRESFPLAPGRSLRVMLRDDLYVLYSLGLNYKATIAKPFGSISPILG